MRISFLLAIALLLSLAPLHADYLKNSNFKDGLSFWHGDATPAFLKPDGTEGTDSDKDAIPVFKLELARSHPLGISQEYVPKDNPAALHVHVEVYASADFKRSKFPSDFSSDINWKPNTTRYWNDGAVPNVDFWIRDDPGCGYRLASLTPGKWVAVDGRFDNGTLVDSRTVWFIVPPGEGTVYIRRPSVSPK